MNHRIPGLRYIPEYIDAATHDDLLTVVSALPWKDIPGQRRIAHRIHEDGLSPRTPPQLAVMDFADSESDETARLLLEPGSALVLSGDARYRWKHGIAPQPSDEWNGQTIQRDRRVSLTFRNVK